MNLQSIQLLIQQHPVFFAALTVWGIVWKGLALWKASQRSERNWFIIILIINSFGILDIIYYYLVGRGKTSESSVE
jgi:hypothetical protein